jgi:hypothetical protein
MRPALTTGFHTAFAVGAGFAALGALIALVALPSLRAGVAARRAEAPAVSEAGG